MLFLAAPIMARAMLISSGILGATCTFQQLGASEIFASSTVLASFPQLKRRSPAVAVVSRLSSPQCSNFRQQQLGFGVASISKSFSFGRRGEDKGFTAAATGESSTGGVTEDVIFLNVGGMSCGGCSASVKRILESQPQVKEANVDFETGIAEVQLTLELESTKRELGETLAKHVTSCGFETSLRE